MLILRQWQSNPCSFLKYVITEWFNHHLHSIFNLQITFWSSKPTCKGTLPFSKTVHESSIKYQKALLHHKENTGNRAKKPCVHFFPKTSPETRWNNKDRAWITRPRHHPETNWFTSRGKLPLLNWTRGLVNKIPSRVVYPFFPKVMN